MTSPRTTREPPSAPPETFVVAGRGWRVALRVPIHFPGFATPSGAKRVQYWFMDIDAEAVGGSVLPDAGSPQRPPHPWRRFVALGDSFTEGLDDPEPLSPGGFRGWADRVAEELASGVPDFAYANLAVRGQVLHEVVDTQLGAALDLQPDLASLQGGGNDLLHPKADPDKLAAILEGAVEALREQAVTVVIFVGPDSGRSTVLGQFRTKIAIFNENVRAIAERHNALIADLWAMTELHDARLWSPDRLHPSSLGHHAIAAMVLDALHVQHSLMPNLPKSLPEQGWRAARVNDIVWARDYLMPWVLNGIRRESTNGGIGAKRPLAVPLATNPLRAAPRAQGETPDPDDDPVPPAAGDRPVPPAAG